MVMRNRRPTTTRRRKAATPKRATPRRKPTTLARTAARAGKTRTRRPSAAAPKRPTAKRLISQQLSKMRTTPRTLGPLPSPSVVRRRQPAPRAVPRAVPPALPPVQRRRPVAPRPVAPSMERRRRPAPTTRIKRPQFVQPPEWEKRKAKSREKTSPRTPIGPARVPMRGGSYGPVAYKSLPSREVATKRAATAAGRKTMAAQKTAQMRGATGNLPIPESRKFAKVFSPESVKARKKTIAATTQRGSSSLLKKQYPKGLTGKPTATTKRPAAPKATVSPRTPLPKAQQKKIEKQVEKRVQAAQNKVHAKVGTGKRTDKSGGFWHRHK